MSVRPATMAGGACGLVAVMLMVTTIDLLTFVLPASPRTGMSGSWDPRKLQWIGLLCGIASLLCGISARQILKAQSPQRAVADHWSPRAIPFWWTLVILGLFVFYPLPYFQHHIDRFLLFLSLVLVWAAWILIHPWSLGRLLRGRLFGILRTILINGLLFLILAEAAMRLADPILVKGGLFSQSSDTPGGGIPFQITDASGMRTNSLGFRDRERSLARPSSAIRILAVGDSFTWGTGALYGEAFITMVERRLQETNAGAEVINLGLVGYQPEEYLALLKGHGLAYQPDLVFVNFFIGNDFMPAQGESIIVAGHRHRVHINGNWFHDHLSWDHWYLSHDLTYAMLLAQAAFRQATGAPDLGMFASQPHNQPTNRDPASFTGWSPRYLQMIQGMGDQYLTRDTPAFLERWRATRSVLEQIDALLRQHAIPWVLVMLPTEEQIDPELQQLYVEARKGRMEEYDFDKPQRLLLTWAKESSVQIIDLTPAFRTNVVRRPYVENDIHWNSLGHALAAQVILEALNPLEKLTMTTGKVGRR